MAKTKWIATNIRFPEEMYMELKREAYSNRISLAKLIRQKLNTTSVDIQKAQKKIDADKFIQELDELAKQNDKENPGVSFSEKLIEMRYEQ